MESRTQSQNHYVTKQSQIVFQRKEKRKLSIIKCSISHDVEININVHLTSNYTWDNPTFKSIVCLNIFIRLCIDVGLGIG